MLDQLIENTYNIMIRSFPPTASYSLQDLSARDLSPDLYRYLSFVLEERSDDEIDNLVMPESPWFDTSGMDVAEAWSAFVIKLKKHPVFPANTWASTLHDAVATLTTFAMTPIQGLEQILFREDDSIRTALAEGRLLQLTMHPVIVKAAKQVFDSAEDHFIARGTFRDRMIAVIHTLTGDYSPEDWETFADPVFQTASRATGGGSCPLEAVTAFFDDLGLREHANRIHTHATRYKLTDLDSSQLYDALIFRSPSEIRKTERLDHLKDTPGTPVKSEPVLDSETENPSDSLHVVGESVVTPAQEVDLSVNTEEVLDDSDDSEPAPLWKKFQKKLNAPVVETPAGDGTASLKKDSQLEVFDQPVELPPHRPEKGALSDYSTAEPPSVPIWERFRDRASSDEPVSDFGTVELRVLGESVRKNRQRFIATLFGGSRAEYEDVIRHIDRSTNWDEASLYIADAVFRKHRVNIYSELAVSFTNAVEQRYRAIQAD